MTIQSIRAGRLDVAYLDEGPGEAGTALLLHGWPDDPHGWDEIVPAMVDAGWRVIRPWTRGFGGTKIVDGPQTGDLSALAGDALALMDALNLSKVAVIGHDWGARAAYIAACAHPKRFSHCVGMSVGWGTNDPNQALSLTQVQNYWYHWYMALDRGETLVREDRATFTRRIWDLWSVLRPLQDDRFAAMVQSFETDDWADVVLHSYRVRWGLAEAGPDAEPLSSQVASDPVIKVPSLTLHGGSDPCNAPSTSEGKDSFFSGGYYREVMDGVGHFPQWEAPEETARLVLTFLEDGK